MITPGRLVVISNLKYMLGIEDEEETVMLFADNYDDIFETMLRMTKDEEVSKKAVNWCKVADDDEIFKFVEGTMHFTFMP